MLGAESKSNIDYYEEGAVKVRMGVGIGKCYVLQGWECSWVAIDRSMTGKLATSHSLHNFCTFEMSLLVVVCLRSASAKKAEGAEKKISCRRTTRAKAKGRNLRLKLFMATKSFACSYHTQLDDSDNNDNYENNDEGDIDDDDGRDNTDDEVDEADEDDEDD